jgi:hypothetical protein
MIDTDSEIQSGKHLAEKEGLPHLFIFAPIPEAKPVIDRFVECLKHTAVCSS